MKYSIEYDYDYGSGWRIAPDPHGVDVPDALIERYREVEDAHAEWKKKLRAISDELEPYTEQMEAINHRRDAEERLRGEIESIQQDYPEITEEELRGMLM